MGNTLRINTHVYLEVKTIKLANMKSAEGFKAVGNFIK
jgi:hypothetical protein